MVNDLAFQRDKYKHLTDEEWRWMLQQVEGRERTADKLPAFASIPDWWYPVRLSCEQCSSELTAKYKAHLSGEAGLSAKRSNSVSGLSAKRSLLDLTGGYGVDTYFLSEHFDHTDYVEQDAELCRIVEHNLKLKIKNSKLKIHNASAEEFLREAGRYDLIYLDPARRNSHGGKVFRLADCSPDVTKLLPILLDHLTPDGQILLKLSPMLDISQALKELSAFSLQHSEDNLQWSVFVVAVKNEVKEVLLLSHQLSAFSFQPTITAIDLAEPEKAFIFTREEEQKSPFNFLFSPFTFLYEPNAAILKSGAYKLVGERFGLQKLDVNTHLYVSEKLIENFPGRVWKVNSQFTIHNSQITNHQSPGASSRQTGGAASAEKGLNNHQSQITNANIVCRNYPLTAEQLKKKLKLRDGGTTFVIGCRVQGKPTLLLAERV